MKKPIRSDLDLEGVVKPLVAALKVPKLSDACRILFVNGDLLTLSAELEQVGIVALQGSKEGNIEGADLVVSQSQIQLIKIIQEVLPQLIQEYAEPIVSASVSVATIQNEEERQSVLAAKIVEKIGGQKESKQFWRTLTPYMGGAIKPLAELLVGSLYKFYYERYKAQRQVIAEFEDVVVALRRLGLLSPFLSLALCPGCNNYEVVFSKVARFNPNCPRCGASWPVLTVNEFPQSFASMKMKNRDLPVFISAYLRAKSPLAVDVLPNAEFNMKSGKVEVDVLIPDTGTGLECKCYTNNIAVSDSTINSEAGKIKQQIERYLELGITRVVVITNYSDIDAKKLGARLRDQLEGLHGLCEWKVLGSDMTAFAEFLDEESGKINDTLNDRMQRTFQRRIGKQLAKRPTVDDCQ